MAVDDDLARRLAALEYCATSSTGTGMERDLRVIEMQISRAEDKILRLGKTASCTQPWLSLGLAADA